MAPTTNELAPQEGTAHRETRRRSNRRTAEGNPSVDAQGLVEFGCECTRTDCERMVTVPLYVYQRIVEAGDQYLLQAGHHALERYRTIISVGLIRIEQRV